MTLDTDRPPFEIPILLKKPLSLSTFSVVERITIQSWIPSFAEAGRLRARLADYYAAEGATDNIIIEVPKGGYVPVFRLRRSDKEAPKSLLRQLRPLIVGITLLVILVAMAGWWRFDNQTEPLAIAVLPLENLGHDPANDYFVDGLTNEIINNLSVIQVWSCALALPPLL